jgi:hypothetical protein
LQRSRWEYRRVWSGLIWGIPAILAAILIIIDNKGLITHDEGWLYFAIGAGVLFTIGFFIRYFGNFCSRWRAFHSLMWGIGLIFIGFAFLYGFCDWWPLVLVPFSLYWMAKSIWYNRRRPIFRYW